MAKFFAVLVALAIVFWGMSFLWTMFAPVFEALLNSPLF